MMMSSKMIFNALFAVTLVLCIFACQKNSEMIDPNAAETNAFVPPTTSARLSNKPNIDRPAATQRAIIVARGTDVYLESRYLDLFRAHRDWKAICIDINLADIPVGNFFGLTVLPPIEVSGFNYSSTRVNCDNSLDLRYDPNCSSVCWLNAVLGYF
jgi:hypothetical protein